MPQPPKDGVEVRDFPGLITNIGGDALPDGAAEVQVNVTGVKAGELRSRPALVELTFDSEG